MRIPFKTDPCCEAISKADPKKAGQGSKAITSALIGFAIVFLSYSIIKIIGIITGFDILNSKL